MQDIQTRRRNPVRPATSRIYQSYLDSHILPFFNRLDTELIENGVAKRFIQQLNGKNLAPSTINAIFNIVKAVIASEVDENGNEINPRKWNPDFIDLPIVNKQNVDAPIVTPEQVTDAISSLAGVSKQMQAMLVLLAASGLRVGELLALQGCRMTIYDALAAAGLALRGENTPLKGTYGFSYWDPETAIIHIKSTLVRGVISQQPKTDAGNRQIDLHPDINEYLKHADLPDSGFLFQSHSGGRVRVETAYDDLYDLGIDGFHSFRRFRATHLESQNVPRSLTSYWLGHAGNSITDRYIKIGQNLQIRKEWAIKAGYGFQL